MQFGIELLARDLETEADFFYVAVPHDLELPPQTERLFVPQVMQVLAAEGRRLGREPSSWQTEALAPESPGSPLRVDPVLRGTP